MILLLFAFLISNSSAYGSDEIIVRKATGNEQYERDVDQVALAAQSQAISKLSTLLKKYRGTKQEPTLLAKLAELQQQNAAIRFRIAHGEAHGEAHGGRKPLNLSSYHKEMRQSITTLTELIKRFPNCDDLIQAYFLRGKGYEEIGDKELATKDYLYLVAHFSETDEAISAYMSLANFAIETNNHQQAIIYLREVEKRPDAPQYPFALYKLAWSHYNLKNIPAALSYAERNIAATPATDTALRENTLLDIPVFFLEGYEQKLAPYATSEALAYFRKLEKGQTLGKMFVRYAKLLRSHNHDQALISWKDQVLTEEADRSESLEVLMTAFEHQLNNRQYAAAVESTQDMIRLYQNHPEFEAFPKAQKLVLDAAEGIQKIVIKNRGKEGVQTYSNHLAAMYDAFTKIVDESDARIPRVHYNLAETLFEIRDFEPSTRHYRWVVEHPKLAKGPGAPTVADSSLKAIASRYEGLRLSQRIPGELKPLAIPEADPKTLEPAIKEWIEWIDSHLDNFKWKTGEPIENFLFEANRALYAAGHIKQATQRMSKFAFKHPQSQFAMPSASLALDSMIAAGKWENAHELAEDFLDIKEWKNSEFSRKLFATAADSFYKIIEQQHQAKDFDGTLNRTDKFLKKYATSARLGDSLALAGSAALSLGDKVRAESYFSKLLTDAPQSDTAPTAYLARAALTEERYEFARAAQDYSAWLSTPIATQPTEAERATKLRTKTLVLAWLAGTGRDLREILTRPALCPANSTADETEQCSAFQALSILQSIEQESRIVTPNDARSAYEKTRKGSNREKALWSTVALQNTKDLEFRERLSILRNISNNWEELEPLTKFALLPLLSESIPRAFQESRNALRKIAPLRATERHITHRIDSIREIENAATKAMKLPWARIRASVLNEVAAMYLDLSRDLQKLTSPENGEIQKLVLPFEEKGQDLRAKAFEIASRFAIEENSFQQIAEPFFAENPSQAKALRPATAPARPTALDLAWFNTIEERTENNWSNAITARKWPQVAFFLQEAKEQKTMSERTQSLARAISLATAGAQAEALPELEEAYKLSEKQEAQLAIARMLHTHYVFSLERDRAKKWGSRVLVP